MQLEYKEQKKDTKISLFSTLNAEKDFRSLLRTKISLTFSNMLIHSQMFKNVISPKVNKFKKILCSSVDIKTIDGSR